MTISREEAGSQNSSRGAILDAARTILIQRDYGRFSMRGVAAEAGCTPDTVYLHFESEQLLLNSIVDEAFNALLEVLEGTPETNDPIGSLREKLQTYVRFGLQFPHHYRVAYINRPPGRFVSHEDRPHACYDFLRDSVSACIDQDFAGSVDIDLISQVLWASVHGVTSALIVMPKFPWVDREQLIGRVIDTAIEGMLQSAKKRPRLQAGP